MKLLSRRSLPYEIPQGEEEYEFYTFQCKFKQYECKKCKSKGYIAAACRKSINNVEEMNEIIEMLKKHFSRVPLSVTNVLLKTYNGEILKPC
ncbi:hypothetical protein NQ315_012287, partial [Exocentrus adspersus]